MKTKKTRFWLTLMLVLACVCIGFAFVGCEKSGTPSAEHVHNYTEWHYTNTEHWRVCPEDGAATEKSPHSFIDGKCECGFVVDTREFGTVTGKITLHGGKNADDYSDVTVDFEGDDVIVSVDKDGNFIATHVTVGKAYDVTVSKEGYSSQTAAVRLDTKDETVDLVKPFALEYQRLQSWLDKDLTNFDLSHMNDENPYISSVADGDLGVITRDVYDDVAVSVWLTKVKDDSENYPQKGVLVKFEGDQYMILRIHDNKLLRWDAATWGQETIENKDTNICDLSSDQLEKLKKEEGIKLTLVRHGNALYTYLDGEFILAGTKILSQEYADDKVQVGFWEFAPKANKVWNFDIEEDVSDYEVQIPTFDAPEVTVENGTIAFDKTSYKYGETATVTLTPEPGYVLSELKVYGESVFNGVESNMYSFTVTGKITVEAVFADYQLQDVGLTVNGLKMGEIVQLSGEVTLINIADANDTRKITLTESKATVNDLVTPGTYKVVFSDGNYYDGTLTLEKGETTATVMLQYKCFDAWANGDLNRLDLSHMNEKDPYISSVADGDFGVITRDFYDDVSVSVWLTKVKDSGDQYPNKGVFIKFEDGKYMILRIHDYYQGGSLWLRWDKTIWNLTTVENAETWICELNSEQEKKFNSEEGIKLTLVRRGNMLYAFLDDVFMPGEDGYAGNGTRTLPEEYADDKVQVGFWEFAPKANKNYKFNISSDIPTFDAPEMTVENGTIVFDKTSYKFGETVTITVKAEAGYTLRSLRVCGEDVTSLVKNNMYSFTVTGKITVEAVFADYQLQDVVLTVNGLKMGETEQLSGEVTLINIADANDTHKVTLTESEATVNGLVTPGTYKVVFSDGNYCDGTLTLEKGVATATVTLQYKRFDAWANGDLNRLDLSHMNEKDPYISSVADGDFGVITRDFYDDVSVSVWLKKNNNAGAEFPQKGVLVQFEDGKHMILRIHRYSDGTYWLCWNIDTWGQPMVETEKWICQLTDEQMQKYESEEGIKLTLVRKGNKLYAYLDDVFMPGEGTYAGNGTRTLSEEYADDKVQVGFWEMSALKDKDWKFNINDNPLTPIA